MVTIIEAVQRIKLYARTDYESTIYSILMHQNLLFFMEKLPKMAVSWSRIEYFGLRQAVAEPPISRVLDAEKHALWTHRLPKHNLQHSYAPKSAILQQNRRKLPFFFKKCLFLFSLKEAAEPPPLPIGGCLLQKSKIRQRTT